MQHNVSIQQTDIARSFITWYINMMSYDNLSYTCLRPLKLHFWNNCFDNEINCRSKTQCKLYLNAGSWASLWPEIVWEYIWEGGRWWMMAGRVERGSERGRDGARKGGGNGSREGSKGGSDGRSERGRDRGRERYTEGGPSIRTMASIQCTGHTTTNQLALATLVLQMTNCERVYQ